MLVVSETNGGWIIIKNIKHIVIKFCLLTYEKNKFSNDWALVISTVYCI